MASLKRVHDHDNFVVLRSKRARGYSTYFDRIGADCRNIICQYLAPINLMALKAAYVEINWPSAYARVAAMMKQNLSTYNFEQVKQVIVDNIPGVYIGGSYLLWILTSVYPGELSWTPNDIDIFYMKPWSATLHKRFRPWTGAYRGTWYLSYIDTDSGKDNDHVLNHVIYNRKNANIDQCIYSFDMSVVKCYFGSATLKVGRLRDILHKRCVHEPHYSQLERLNFVDWCESRRERISKYAARGYTVLFERPNFGGSYYPQEEAALKFLETNATKDRILCKYRGDVKHWKPEKDCIQVWWGEGYYYMRQVGDCGSYKWITFKAYADSSNWVLQ